MITVKILYIIFAYLCGSIPFAYLIAKAKGVDIRKVGSGNPGATNVFRTVGKVPGVITFILDMAKGFLPVFAAKIIFNEPSFYYLMAIAAAAFIGHIYTVFLRFKGGKGMATGCGVFLALLPSPVLIAVLVFAVVLILSGYVALASIMAAVTLPIATFLLSFGWEFVVFAGLAAALVIYKHKSNISRLISGTENRFKIFGSKNK